MWVCMSARAFTWHNRRAFRSGNNDGHLHCLAQVLLNVARSTSGRALTLYIWWSRMNGYANVPLFWNLVLVERMLYYWNLHNNNVKVCWSFKRLLRFQVFPIDVIYDTTSHTLCGFCSFCMDKQSDVGYRCLVTIVDHLGIFAQCYLLLWYE